MSNLDKLIPAVDVPEGESGSWRVSRFTIDPIGAQAHNMRCAFQPGMGRRTVKVGTYTKLTHGGGIVMSDTCAEKWDHCEAVAAARGIILINGLGLGVVLNACLLKPDVTRAIVVEKSQDVTKLCASHYRAKFGDRLEIVLADALDYSPPKGVRFGMVWHDIWPAICGDNLPEMKALHRRYGRRTDWQGSWARELCARGF